MAFTYTRLSDPTRVEVRRDDAWIATFTAGCYTVTLAGPERTFVERHRSNGQTRRVEVTHATWVRAAPGPASPRIDERWLTHALDANAAGTPDALGIAVQYLKGAPAVTEGDLQIAGDASYGPRDSDGRRQERSDFNDYLGLTWLYPTDPPDRPERAELHCLDCSGYMRMVWGYRHHLPGSGYLDSVPLSILPRDGTTLPRRAVQQCASAPGLMLIENGGTQVTDFSRMSIGDLVFFDADRDDGPAIDHVGMYLGVDTAGHHRFISSRKTVDGPTFADVGGPSLLDGRGYYARAFRAVRRL